MLEIILDLIILLVLSGLVVQRQIDRQYEPKQVERRKAEPDANTELYQG